MAREFRLPDLGEGIAEGQIVSVLCKEGDEIKEDQALMEVETDKAAVEIPSPFAGVAKKVHVKPGQTVAVGEVLVTFDDGNGQAATSPKKEAAPAKAKEKPKAPERKPPAPQPTPRQPEPQPRAAAAPPPAHRRTRAAAAPAVRKLAREMGVDIDALQGTGPGGRVVRSDVEVAAAGQATAPAARIGGPPEHPVARGLAPLVTGDFPAVEGDPGQDKWGAIKRAKLTQIRKTIANQMVRSVSNIPHVTHHDEIDVTELELVRQRLRGEDDSGPRVTMMAFVIKSLAHVLRLHPHFNASFDAENEAIIYKQYINIGVAVDSPRGLVVPVIRDVDRLTVLGIAQELSNVARKVRDTQFGVDELRGGTFTVTNYGALGGIFGTPIINYPEVAILGIGRTREQLALEDDELTARRLLPVSLSFDHRATDGAQAARFVNDLAALLSEPGLLLLSS